MLLVIAAVIVVVFVLFSFLKKKRPEGTPPIASVGLPIVGNYIEFAKNPVSFIEKCYKKFGNVYTVPMLHKNLTFLLGPEASAIFFQLPDDKMSQAEVYGFMTPIFGKGVVYDAEPKRRVQQMQCVGQGLKSNRLRDYVPRIEKETVAYMKQWGTSGKMNLLEVLSEMTILTSSRCLHGDDVRENLFAEVSRIYHDLDKGVTPLSFFFPNAPTEAHRKRDAARQEMISIFSKVIAKRRESGDTQETRSDVLQMYIDFKYKEDGTGLTDENIVGLLIALLFAGQHTSSITSTWTIFFLLHNQRCLKEAMKEQEEVFAEEVQAGKQLAGCELTFDKLAKMVYLDNCVKEALRMFPPLIMLMRMAMEDIETIHNGQTFLIPKGDIVITSPAVSSRIDSVFKNPNAFEPERFGPERNEHKPPFAYLGFGGGRHQCLGQQFGVLQVKTIVSLLIRNFQFEAVDDVMPEPDYQAMVVGPKNHLEVNYVRMPGSMAA